MTPTDFLANLTAATAAGTPIDVIFLDVDGVLLPTQPKSLLLDPECLRRFLGLVRQSKAKIVLSTSWRLVPVLRAELCTYLAAAGLDLALLVGQTPDLLREKGTRVSRADEVAVWVAGHLVQVASWVIVDDVFMDPQQCCTVTDHAVQTVGEFGLQDHDVALALRILNGEVGGVGGVGGALHSPVEQMVLAGDWG
jgi:hypothetical protein